MKMISTCLILFFVYLTNANNFTAIRIYSNLAEIVRPLDKLPLEFQIEDWNVIRSDSMTLFGENINITLQTITEKINSLNGTTVYIRSPLSSEKTTNIQLIKAIIIDETIDLVKIQDQSIADNQPLYFTVSKDQMYYLDQPPKSKYVVNFKYTNPSKSPIFLSYLQTNINWHTEYRLDLYENRSDLIAMANIRNDGKFPITINQSELIGGDINLQESSIQSNRNARSRSAPVAFLMKSTEMSDTVNVGQGIELAGLYVFPIDKSLTIDGKSNYLLSMFRPRITIERYGFISKTFSTDIVRGNAQRAYRLRSDRYLTQGSCIIREQNRIVGETTLPNLAAKNKHEFFIGDDANIVYKENVTLISLKTYNETESGIKKFNEDQITPVVITLRSQFIYEIHLEIQNFKDRTINIEYEQNGFFNYRTFKMIKTNKHRFIQESSTIKSNMTLKANSKEIYSYTVELIN